MNVSSIGAIIMLDYDNIGFFCAVILIGMARFNKYHMALTRGGDSGSCRHIEIDPVYKNAYVIRATNIALNARVSNSNRKG
jgi:hypothetical protein